MTYGPDRMDQGFYGPLFSWPQTMKWSKANDLLDFLVASKYYDGVLTLYKLIIKPNRLGLIYGPTHDLLNDTSPKAE